ncbi:Histone deacetylase complex subunit [Sporothrix stenoceras]|uniref:Histone deacetylase complex subunit n=1 Tax=Sporothrix stenoceras TaxID=5173 RepID=A0ABR3Z488_9PEZI
MAGPDPRRSSRARTNQPVSRPSSTTSSVSGRIERHSSSKHHQFVKTGSPQKSSTSTASLASEPPDDAAGTDDNTPPPPTRSRRAAHHSNVIKDDEQDQSSVVVSEIEMTNDGDDIQEDDEAVRCICGNEDYPGLPAAEDIEQAAKDGYDVEAIFPAVVTDDLAGFFVQCDICKVWQHGACVGLINDATLPEEYYCEECRTDLHKILPGTNNHRCSIYLALNRRRSRTGSFNKNRERTPQRRDSSKDSKDGDRDIGPDGGRESKQSRSAAAAAAKRRSTMNSRDAAYDEEQLLIALAASREDASDPADPTPRRPKRSRSDSEEKADMKRQRTSSRSVSPPGDKSTLADDSDDAMATRNGSSKKASRSAALARSQAQRERAEREEKERQRAEAASKRNGRAERRRVDDSDPSDEAPLATTRAAAATRTTSAPAPPTATPATASTSGNTSATPTNAPSQSATPAPATAARSAPPRPSQPSPETPPPTSAPAMAQSKSKGGRPTHKKKGRNQYTKERDAREELNSMTRSRSRDVPENGQGKPGSSGGGGGSHGNQNSKSGSRSKGGNANSRVSLTEMRRRVSAMSDFIGKTQIDIASGEYLASAVATPDGGKAGSGSNGNGNNVATNPSSAATTPSSTSAPQLLATSNGVSSDTPEKDFKKLPLLEMMDTLTRNIIHWQNQYGN